MADEIVVEATAGRIAAFDVPLVGDGPSDEGEQPADRPPPNWRRVLAVSLVGGAIVGVVGGAILVGSDDDADDAGASLPDDDLSAQITTPPTLGALDTIPVPDDPALARVDDAPQPTSSQDWDLFAGVTVPSYPAVTNVGLADLVDFDIAGAVARLGEDRPRRSETHLELGAAGFEVDVTIERDVERDRYGLIVDVGGDVQRAVVDVPGNRTLFTAGDGLVAEQSNDELLADVEADSVHEFFDALLLGPLRPDSYNPVATRGRGLVTIRDDRVARQFLTVIDGALIPEWQLYVFGPAFEFPVEDRPLVLEYSAYVNEAGDIVQVDGVSLVGDIPQLITHRITEPDEPIVVELPEVGDPAPETSSSTPMTPPPPGN